ncbi:LysR family transcriptional regulator [Pseudomonas chlororaphis]|uniref:LysR family transcriptional regulator n=1 Tax=Pseudomonas chlororaphis TaxID=587753 RepID=UPI001B30E938|nr:LysR family transcriptional regulator [Pseudomonas chlororaphis]MBP5058839.1 LysR family transcriptional regulator [Pseudomonas chlororaphis]MBP5142957.1 LysR family transcriptional regulator [Pseudomonas chlororaphis]QTT98279.1 LysR family transcriptional regulator [Pseudomonas chlororaphis]
MELRQLRQALVLADTLNFHRAAEQLSMTQPPLSTSIKKLEDELGVLLFERLPSGLRLTQAGDAVLRNARSALFFVEEMRRAARESESGERGQLRVGFVGTAAYTLLPGIIGRFREQYPHVDLVLEEGIGSDLLQRLEDHELDVALVRFPIAQPDAVRITPLMREHLVLAVRHDSPLAGNDQVAIADLTDQPLIISSQSRSPAMYALMLRVFEEAGIQPRIVQQAAQLTTALGLVESGLGVAMIPLLAAKYVGPDIRVVALSGLSENLLSGIALATLPGLITTTARNFCEHAMGVAT